MDRQDSEFDPKPAPGRNPPSVGLNLSPGGERVFARKQTRKVRARAPRDYKSEKTCGGAKIYLIAAGYDHFGNGPPPGQAQARRTHPRASARRGSLCACLLLAWFRAGSVGKIMARILLVDGVLERLQTAAMSLREDGHSLWIARGVSEGRQALLSAFFDVVFTSQQLPDGQAADLVSAAQSIDSALPVIFFASEPGNTDNPGAFDIVSRDSELDQMRRTARRAGELSALRRENLLLRSALEALDQSHVLHGESAAVRALRERISEIATSNLPVLITGEVGSGKQVVAHAIHATSARRSKPFLRLTGSRLGELLERGADPAQSALLNASREGSLFLDEIGLVSSYAEPAILHLIQHAQLARAGSNERLVVENRILLGTRGSLQEVIDPARFRFSWVQRLDLVRVHVPPLRERLEDVAGLCEFFSLQTAADLHVSPRAIGPGVIEKLYGYNFPGNIRELRSLVRRAYMISNGTELRPGDFLLPAPESATADLPSMAGTTAEPGKSFDLLAYLQRTEERLIRSTLHASGGAQAEAARRMGISRSLLAYKLQKYGIRPPSR